MDLVEQLGDVVGRWYFQLHAIWCWYLPLCNYIKDVLIFVVVSIFSFWYFSGVDQFDGMADDTSKS